MRRATTAAQKNSTSERFPLSDNSVLSHAVATALCSLPLVLLLYSSTRSLFRIYICRELYLQVLSMFKFAIALILFLFTQNDRDASIAK